MAQLHDAWFGKLLSKNEPFSKSGSLVVCESSCMTLAMKTSLRIKGSDSSARVIRVIRKNGSMLIYDYKIKLSVIRPKIFTTFV